MSKKNDPSCSVVAVRLGLLLIVTTLVSLLLLAADWASLDDLVELLKILYAPIVALTGSVLGFYFGGKASE